MQGKWTCPASSSQIAQIADDMNKFGYGVIRDFVSPEEVQAARNLASSAVDSSNGEYVCFKGAEQLTGTVLNELFYSSSLKRLCGRLYEHATGAAAPEDEFYQVFRCLQGRSGQRNSNVFHYDSYVVTALLPIALPEEGRRGDLLMFPNTRRVRRSYILNVLDKAIIDNKFSHIVLKEATRRKLFQSIKINMRPGDMYFFWGYRSIHTNEPCDPDKLRATALFHYGDPHQNSRVRSLMRRGWSGWGFGSPHSAPAPLGRQAQACAGPGPQPEWPPR